jgi:hypothetical protein
MSDNLRLYRLQVARFEEQLVHLRNHATTLIGCEKAVYYIDKAIADVRSGIGEQLASLPIEIDAEPESSPSRH